MTKDEAMKLALGALEAKGDAWIVLERKAREALRQALAQPEQEPVGYADQHDLDRAGNDFWVSRHRGNNTVPLYTAPPNQPEQEPVGYFQYDIRLDAWVQNKECKVGTAFYTAPPKREWQGLTDDEVNEFAAGCHLGNSVQGAIYKAQAKLKEKNT